MAWETVVWLMAAVCVCVCVCVCFQGVYTLNTGVVSILQYNTQKMFLAHFKEFGFLSRRTCEIVKMDIMRRIPFCNSVLKLTV